MIEDKIQSDLQNTSLFTPEERQRVLENLLNALQTDNRIAGVLIVGSSAVGFEDIYSDIDLSVVVSEKKNVFPVFSEWREKITKLFPVIHCFEATFGPNNFLHGFLLDGFLELDIGFLCLANLSAKRERWKVAFDHSGRIEDIMQSSWENKPQQDIQADYLSRINSIWHYITHVIIALKRGQPWRAFHYLEVIRNRTIEVAGLRRGLDTGHFRQVDQMPENLLSELQQTLVSNLDAGDIMAALKVATTCFFNEARALDETLKLNVATELETKMRQYLEIFELQNLLRSKASKVNGQGGE
jgi:predicted nucleotidyltransferase